MGRWNSMSHEGLENDMTPPEHLIAMAGLWHYGWQWKGPEPSCDCAKGTCGLVIKVEWSCDLHTATYASAKQLHKALECPGPT